MKLVRREFGADYENYQFGYSFWGVLEPGDRLSEVYAQGFLPYSGKLEASGTLYMARSIRIGLEQWKPNSENRRVLRKAEWGFIREVTSFRRFDAKDAQFLQFCNGYFLDRHQKDIRTSGKLEAVFAAGFISEIVTYRTDQQEVLGYILLAGDDRMCHFWFSFYDPTLAGKSLGMWLMIQEVISAQERGQNYIYLGTCYGPSALYKTNFDCIEWWDGSQWSTDKRRLKALARGES